LAPSLVWLLPQFGSTFSKGGKGGKGGKGVVKISKRSSLIDKKEGSEKIEILFFSYSNCTNSIKQSNKQLINYESQ
jgi:hypothetical protein